MGFEVLEVLQPLCLLKCAGEYTGALLPGELLKLVVTGS